MTGKELVKKMADFYRENPRAWTKRAFARLKNGEKTGSLDPDAASWCVSGLVRKLYCEERLSFFEGLERAETDAILLIRDSIGFNNLSIPDWNDTRESVEDVIRLLDKAAA